ncbi:CDT1-like protein b isoform X2 [Hordeum vulgare subsp. vulgare]|uniref:CDT1-like protein b isoform X2 n=1 Tax=Hordeum vulgare subsp. vulgare TaxID=112509 RepID=UPI001D1A5A76|nr:CDT1-like protein b isoform X2 [Hordeum vulgare subsp. vulgare]
MPGWTRSSLLRGSSAWAPASAAAPSSAGPSYEILCEFFNCFESSTRLLRMKGSKATFPNICASIRNLAERRFTYGHLAQLKYIMPEAMMLAFILQNLGVHDL